MSDYSEREIRLMAERDAALVRAEKAEEQRAAVYRERDACVAAMARMAQNLGWPVGMARHPDEDTHWEEDWRNIVFFEIPVPQRGQLVQVSWHVHDTEMPLFKRVPPYPKKWDGHTTEQKYEALAQFCGRGV